MRKNDTRSKIQETGFTLIELLVVISIISLLATVALASLNDARAKARDAQRVTEMKEVQKALQLYWHDHQEYPQEGVNTVFSSCDTGATSLQNGLADLEPDYIPEIPSDPENSTYCYYYTTQSIYSCETAPPETFVLYFSTESTTLNMANLYFYSGSSWFGPITSFYCLN